MKLLRSFLLALLLSLLFGLAVGTWLRLQLERAPVYIGGIEPAKALDGPANPPDPLAGSADPGLGSAA